MSEKAASAQSGPEQPLLRVLILDEDPTRSNQVRRSLAALTSIECTIVSDALDGLKQISKGTYDALVLGIQAKATTAPNIIGVMGNASPGATLVLIKDGEADEETLKGLKALAEAHDLQFKGILSRPLDRKKMKGLFEGLKPRQQKRQFTPLPSLTVEEIEHGLEAGFLEPHYQPKVAFQGGKLIGFEALARWRTDEGKLVPPGCFIPQAEESGIITKLTKRLVNTVLDQLGEWILDQKDYKVSLNVSVDDLESDGFAEYVIEKAIAAGVPADQLVIEVTESKISNDPVKSLATLSKLRMAGFGIAIDDFGTGFSSLEQLQKMPVTELKIDRAFVYQATEDKEKRIILEHSVSIGRTLGLTVVTEGVETFDDWARAAEAGADICQGWFAGKALPAEEIDEWIEDWESRIPAPIAVKGENQPKRRLIFGLGLTEVLSVASIAIGMIGLYPVFFGDRTPAPYDNGDQSVAVLPFENLTGDPGLEHVGLGLTEEILDDLVQVSDLRIPSRTSSFAFKGQNIDIREVANTLGVASVLEGSVRQEGNRLKITAQLIDGISGTHIFSDTFEGETDTPVRLQEQIAADIAGAIMRHFNEDDAFPLSKTTVAPEVKQLFARGKFEFANRIFDPASLQRAIGYFQQAVSLDPDYADAWAWLATAMVQNGQKPSGEAALVRAQALDPTNPTVGALLEYVRVDTIEEYPSLFETLEKAIEKRPYDSQLQLIAADAYRRAGYFGASTAHAKLAWELDPFNAVAARGYFLLLALAGRNEELQRSLDAFLSDPRLVEDPNNFVNCCMALTVFYAKNGLRDDYNAMMERFKQERLGAGNGTSDASLGRGAAGPLAGAGMPRFMAPALLQSLQQEGGVEIAFLRALGAYYLDDNPRLLTFLSNRLLPAMERQGKTPAFKPLITSLVGTLDETFEQLNAAYTTSPFAFLEALAMFDLMPAEVLLDPRFDTLMHEPKLKPALDAFLEEDFMPWVATYRQNPAFQARQAGTTP